MMNCCGTGTVSLDDYRYISTNTSNTTQTYTAEYNPSGIDSGNCPVDRKGNSMYAAFPAVGDHYANCRSSCLHGHPQDPSFTLNSPDISAELPIAERGVEIYENYGLDTNIRIDSGKYGTSNDYMQCITDLGRKVSLFGNVTLNIKTNISYITEASSLFTPPTAGVDKFIFLGSPDVYYELIVDLSQKSTDRYAYYGNHGVTFHYGGIAYSYIHGKINDLPEVGYTIGADSVTYYISSSGFHKRVNDISVNHCKPESMVIYSQGSPINITNNSNRCEHWNFDSDGPAALFPLPWTDPYFTRSDYTSKSAWSCTDTDGGYGSSITNTPGDCYGSGAKSAYVPPHMEIINIGYYQLTYNSSDGKVGDTSSSGNTMKYAATRYLSFNTTVRCEDSLYANGTFPAFGTPSNSLPPKSNAVTTNRNAVIKVPPGTLYSITVHVRQDDNFYNKYIKSTNHGFAPEIFLIPGISNAANFSGKLNAAGVKSRLGNPLQLMHTASAYWSSANPYWSVNPSSVVINELFNPGDTLYGINDGPPMPNSVPRNINLKQDPDESLTCIQNKSGFDTAVNSSTAKRDFSSKSKPKSKSLIKDMIESVAGTQRAIALKYIAKGKAVARKSLHTIGFAVTPSAPTGQYRIVSFDVINGVYSIEWLYVLYYCMMNGRKNIQYDNDPSSPTYRQYKVVNCNLGTAGQFGKETCGRECLLFRDDYSYQVVGSSPCAADGVMESYAGMRNLTIYYGTWQPTSNIFANESSCLTQQQFCPALFNQLCNTSPSNTGAYVTAEMAGCTDTEICNYCNVTVNQLLLTIDGCTEKSGNTVTNFGDICGDAQCSYTVVTDGTTTTDDGGSGQQQGGSTPVDDSNNYWIIILIIIIVIVAIVSLLFFYKKYHSR